MTEIGACDTKVCELWEVLSIKAKEHSISKWNLLKLYCEDLKEKMLKLSYN